MTPRTKALIKDGALLAIGVALLLAVRQGCKETDAPAPTIAAARPLRPVVAVDALFYQSPDAPTAMETKLAHDRNAGHDMRASFVEAWADANSNDKLPIEMALGDPDTMLVISTTHGHCSRPLLVKLAQISGDPMRRVGFTMLMCSDVSASVDL
jgi:hypothetical protein